jgi:membrane protein DedA with SNARE-associated domain
LNLAALYVYSGIVGWIFVTGVGLLPFIPEEVAVATLGAWVHKNPQAMLILSWLFCLAAVLGTDLFLYMIGRIGGPKLMSKPWVQKLLKPERVQIFADKFQQRGIWFMLSARLIPGWRTAVFITAGVIRYPTERFLIADAISSIPLVTFFFFGGYYAADWIDAIIANLHLAQNVILLLVLLGVLLLTIALYFRWMRKKEKEEAVAEQIQHQKMEDAGQLPVTPQNMEDALHEVVASSGTASGSPATSPP